MLSVNSNPTSVMAFKGKPSAKDMKKAYKAMEEIHLHTIMSDTRISIERKTETLFRESITKVAELVQKLIAKKKP